MKGSIVVGVEICRMRRMQAIDTTIDGLTGGYATQPLLGSSHVISSFPKHGLCST